MEMAAIPTGEQAIVFLAEALGAERELSETESRILQRAIVRETGAFRRWTAADDTALLKMHKAKIRGAAIARSLNRSENSVYGRLRDLKKAGRVRNG